MPPLAFTILVNAISYPWVAYGFWSSISTSLFTKLALIGRGRSPVVGR
ncbi:hypothetical protein [Verrucomicrobium spinosum]|nr:hypothetical protein [Verrucomicrobium spinosum]